MNRYLFSSSILLSHAQFCERCGNSKPCRCFIAIFKDLMYKDMLNQWQLTYIGANGSLLKIKDE